MAFSTATLSSINSSSSTTSASTLATTSAQETSDRFLKLLVAQMQNQDPLSPMDNAQVTSQMAQINTVSGIGQLNTTMQGLTSQFTQLQALQSASLVGHTVLVEGNQLSLQDGTAEAAFELAGAADSVKVEVLSASGQVIDTLDMGAETTGRHAFSWTPETAPASTQGLTFRVTALSGKQAVTTTALMPDQVKSVTTAGGSVALELASGTSVPYSKVHTIS